MQRRYRIYEYIDHDLGWVDGVRRSVNVPVVPMEPVPYSDEYDEVLWGENYQYQRYFDSEEEAAAALEKSGRKGKYVILCEYEIA